MSELLKGLLHAVRLPSGVRRFDAAGVKAVRAEMYRGMPAPAADDTHDVVALDAASTEE